MNTAFEMFDDSAFAEMARVAQSIERINTAHKFDDNTSAKLALAARSMERISTQIGETIPKDFSKRLSSHLQGIDFKNTIQWQEGMFDQIANSLSIPNLPALTSLSDSLTDTAERMRRSLVVPTLIRPTPEEVASPNTETAPPPRNKGGRPSYAWRYVGMELLAIDLLRRGEEKSRHGCAKRLVATFGFTPSHNTWVEKSGLIVFGNSERAAIDRLSEYLKNFIT
ncbi:hypothetical protein SAMN04488117_101586 [Celeribacter baekdonensis]|uniref:Uncharacterized protein n=1 Tax=Celeribacter baekdonensis TaxID=875171 RepID=A0A1G7GJ95_9RHOB|nr:hypothetical protein [Celeribacter baekdonensis]SDE88069.1 hypothetical protein SAMN04488117_101586 [Celeribacter baekdonensis]